MKPLTTPFLRLPALACALALSACGGGSDNTPKPPQIAAVKSVGDSLSDSGTFAGLPGQGRTFTVQGSSDEPYVVWVERIAKAYQLAALCPVYKPNADGTAFGPNSTPGCTNYAIGGARINNPASSGGNDMPLSIPRQLQDAAQAGWNPDDLLVIDGGGNDAADLVTAYLGAAADAGAAYQALLLTQLPPATVQDTLAAPGGPEIAGGLYMQALADTFADDIRAQALDKGAQRVVIANMPAVTYTPRFQYVLDQIAAAGGSAARAQAEALFKGWVDAFNQELASRFAQESRVRVIDIAALFSDMVQNPSSHGLNNVTLPVCGAAWVTEVPLRSFADCTASALSATPPPPGGPAGSDWWQHYLFADSFHPTPYGHSLMADAVMQTLDAAQWH
jgi:phospholipase/lecithinase/hemolysin